MNRRRTRPHDRRVSKRQRRWHLRVAHGRATHVFPDVCRHVCSSITTWTSVRCVAPTTSNPLSMDVDGLADVLSLRGQRYSNGRVKGRPFFAAAPAAIRGVDVTPRRRRTSIDGEIGPRPLRNPEIIDTASRKACAGPDRRMDPDIRRRPAGATGGGCVAQRSERTWGSPKEVLDAGPRRSTIEFVTPDRVTYRPGGRALPGPNSPPACGSM